MSAGRKEKGAVVLLLSPTFTFAGAVGTQIVKLYFALKNDGLISNFYDYIQRRN